MPRTIAQILVDMRPADANVIRPQLIERDKLRLRVTCLERRLAVAEAVIGDFWCIMDTTVVRAMKPRGLREAAEARRTAGR